MRLMATLQIERLFLLHTVVNAVLRTVPTSQSVASCLFVIDTLTVLFYKRRNVI